MIMIPVRLDRIQRALWTVFNDAVSPNGVHWDFGHGTHEALGRAFVGLRLISGPSVSERSAVRGRLVVPAQQILLTVDAATADTRNSVYLNGYQYFYDVQAGDTVTDIRDALLAQINDGEAYNSTATASASGADSILLGASFQGGIYSLQYQGEMSTSGLIEDEPVLVTEGSSLMTIEVQTFSKDRELRNGAMTLASQCLAALQSPAYAEYLTREGIGIQTKSPLTDLTALAGGRWETRMTFDFTLSTPSTFVSPVETIDQVLASASIQNALGATVSTADITVTAP